MSTFKVIVTLVDNIVPIEGADFIAQGLPVHLMGEVFSFGIQDLGYSVDKSEPPKFRAFDAYVGLRNQGRFLNDEELNLLLKELDIPRVPILYKGPFSKEKVLELTKGKETISGKEVHIREGVVVRTTQERKADTDELSFSKTFNRGIKFDGIYGRVQLKSISSDYLTRKNPDATEYQ